MCERDLGAALLESARAEDDDGEAKRILERAGLIVVASARHAATVDTDAGWSVGERERAASLLKSIQDETARREAAGYTRSSSIAVVEVSGPRSAARVDLGALRANIWCAADEVRRSLIAAGVQETRVLVSADPPKQKLPSQAGAVIVNVRPAEREENVVDATAACKNARDREPRKWINPIMMKREHDALIASALPRVAEIEAALASGNFVNAKLGIEALRPAAAEVPQVRGLDVKLAQACEAETQRAARGDVRGKDAAVERLTVCARPIEHTLKLMELAGQSCACANEFDAKDCAERRDTSVARLRGPLLVVAKLDGDDVVLGEFDFKAKRFPLSLKGQLVDRPFEETCDPKMTESCEHQVFRGRVRPDDNRIRIIAAGGVTAPAWRGTIPIDDIDEARALKAKAGSITGAAVFVVRDVVVRSVVKPEADAARRTILGDMTRAKGLKQNATPEARERIRDVEECMRDTPITFQEVTGRFTVVGVSLIGIELDDATDTP